MSLPEDLDVQVPLFIVTGCSGSGKSSLAREVGKCIHNYAVFDMDLIVKYDDYQDACNTWIKVACWFAYHGKRTILFGNVPIPYNTSHSEHIHLFKDVRYLHLHCSPEVRINRLLARKRFWTLESLKSENYLAELMLERSLTASPPIPIVDTSIHSISECVSQIVTWVNSVN